jgi:hypothetical protein
VRYANRTFRDCINALPLELKSEYGTQGLLDHLFPSRNIGGCGVTAVVGARRYNSDWLPLLVGGVPQRLVLELNSLPDRSSLTLIDGCGSFLD